MDIACFRWSCELVSGRAEVASTGAEDLVLGVVCVVRGGGEGESASNSRQNGSLSRGKTARMAVKSTFPAGKCLGFAVIWFTFREEQTRNGRSGYG